MQVMAEPGTTHFILDFPKALRAESGDGESQKGNGVDKLIEIYG